MKFSHNLFLLFIVFLTLSCFTRVATATEEEEEDAAIPSPTDFKTWLKSEPYLSYNKYIFPRTDQSGNVSVDVTYFLVAFTDFNEVSGYINLIGYLTAEWVNDLLTWTVEDNILSSLNIPQDSVWRPPLVLSNSVESLDEIGHKSYRIRLDRYGKCVWTIGLVTKTSCSIDVSSYPFDKQSCDLIFTPWGFDEAKISLYSTESTIDLTHYMENVEWDITSTEVVAKSFSSSSYLYFTINLARKPIYFLVNMVIPILILGLLNGLVFLLPSESGERVGYAITAFLTFAVFLTMVSENLPKASEPMSLLCYFLTLMLVMSALSTIITIMTLRVYHQDEDSDVPKWLRHIIQFVKCRKCKKWCGKKPEIKNNSVSDTNDGLPKKKIFDDDDDDDSDDEDNMNSGEDYDDTKNVNWKEVGRTLDYFFFFLFMVGTVVISIFFLVPLASAS